MTLSIMSCKIYRFTDASVDPNLKTFSINPTDNIAMLQNPNAAANFTDKLKDKFSRETKLILTNDANSDLEFTCTIIEYNVSPIAVTNTETLAQNRLNIGVKVVCVNRKDDKGSYTQSFRDGENYDANADLSSVENNLSNIIFDRLVQQIFNKSFSNW